jgi:hypothetical protein
MSSTDIGTRFVEVLSGRDWNEMEGLFKPSTQFRALVPSGIREASTGVDASEHFQQWFGKAIAVELMGSTVEPLLDRIHIAYRLRVQKDRWYRIEQQAFCTVTEDRIETMDLVCSGFRPEA